MALRKRRPAVPGVFRQVGVFTGRKQGAGGGSTRPEGGASIGLDSPRGTFALGGKAITNRDQRWNSERGEGRLKALLMLLFFVAVGYLGVKLVPPYVNNYQLQDKMVEEARFAGVNRKDPEAVKDDIFKEMKSLNIPAGRDEIQIVSTPPFSIHIALDYTVTVDVPGYQFHLQFHPSADSNSL